jgi:hypothetical protein
MDERFWPRDMLDWVFVNSKIRWVKVECQKLHLLMKTFHPHPSYPGIPCQSFLQKDPFTLQKNPFPVEDGETHGVTRGLRKGWDQNIESIRINLSDLDPDQVCILPRFLSRMSHPHHFPCPPLLSLPSGLSSDSYRDSFTHQTQHNDSVGTIIRLLLVPKIVSP